MDILQPILFNPSEEDIQVKIEECFAFWKPIYENEKIKAENPIEIGLRGEHAPFESSYKYREFSYPEILKAFAKNNGIPLDACEAKWYFWIKKDSDLGFYKIKNIPARCILFSFWVVHQLDEENLRSKLRYEAMHNLEEKYKFMPLKRVNEELRKRKLPVKGKLEDKKQKLKELCLEESVSEIVREVIEGTNSPVNPLILYEFKQKMEEEEKKMREAEKTKK